MFLLLSFLGVALDFFFQLQSHCPWGSLLPASRPYLRRLLLARMRNMIMTLAPMPSPATRKMMPAAVSGSSWHWMTVALESLPEPRRSVSKMPAPGMPRDTVLTREPPDDAEDMAAGILVVGKESVEVLLWLLWSCAF